VWKIQGCVGQDRMCGEVKIVAWQRVDQFRYSTMVKVKAIPVTGREGPWGCETSRLPHFL
jgi:hypothetical protein